MPRAGAIEVDASRAPDLRTSQLELLWRTTRAGRRVWVGLFVFICLAFGSILVFGIVVVILLLVAPPANVSPADPLLLTVYVGLTLLLLATCVVLPAALIVWLARGLGPRMRGRPVGVVADAAGITYLLPTGPSRQVPWGDMQLLDVSRRSSSSRPYREYRLYARGVVIQWMDYSRPTWEMTTGLTRPEFEVRHQALLDLIAAHTGLLPRTSDKRLQRGAQDTPRQSFRSAPLARTGCFAIMLLAVLGFVTALILVPLSTSAPLNLLASGALSAAIALGGINIALHGRSRRRRRWEAAGGLDLAALDDSAVYVLIRHRSLLARLALLLTGLLLAVDLLPVVVLWFPEVGQVLMPDTELRITDGFGVIAAYILLVCGLYGVLCVVGALQSAAPGFRADTAALSRTVRGRERQRIQWEAIVEVRVWNLASGSHIYSASDSGRQTTIVWNSEPPDVIHASNVGETLISGEQLAAIVARWSGVPFAAQANLADADLADLWDLLFLRSFSKARRG